MNFDVFRELFSENEQNHKFLEIISKGSYLLEDDGKRF
jgi:hypothetical protein